MRYLAALIFFIVFLNGVPVFGEEKTVVVDKKWTIEFSTDIDPASVTEATVYVTTETGERVQTIETEVDGHFVYVFNSSAYEYNAGYTLHVEKEVRSVRGESLVSGVEKDFYTEPLPVQVPGDITAEISYNHYGSPEVLVDWEIVPEADGYHFYYRDENSEEMAALTNVDGTPKLVMPPFRDSFVYEGETWSYGVKSVKGNRESLLSQVRKVTIPGKVAPGWIGESQAFVEDMHEKRPAVLDQTKEAGLVYVNGVFAGETASFDYRFGEGKVTRTVVAFPEFPSYSEADKDRFFDYMTEKLSGQFGPAVYKDESYGESGIRSAGWVTDVSIRLVLKQGDDLTTAGIIISPVD